MELARLTRDQSIAQQTEIGARRRLDAAKVELTAAKNGTYLGDSYNDRPSSVQREEEMRQRANDLNADLAHADAEIAWLSQEIVSEQLHYVSRSEADIRAPVNGRIWEMMTSPGEDVQAGQALLKLLDCSGAVVTANVTERVYNRLQLGEQASFEPNDGSPAIRGTIVNLTGASGAPANLAINPDALNKEPYRVTVSMPNLDTTGKDCAVGRTGRVVFNSRYVEAMISALAPGLVALGACLTIVPMLRRDSTFARSLMTGMSIVLLIRYLAWRVTQTLPPPGFTADALVGYPFMLAETASLLAVCLSMLFLSRTIDRSADVRAGIKRAAAAPVPLVDVFICTYNEEKAILERTIIGATGLEHGNYRVWVLDDGRRLWLKRLTEELGCRYLTRPDNRHAKAGNINHALRHVAGLQNKPQFVAILDADFVPMPEFLTRATSLMDDQTVGVVQTPQHFINPDPIQSNLAAAEVWPDEQRFFFDILMPAKDAWGVAFCCGTSSVIRFAGTSGDRRIPDELGDRGLSRHTASEGAWLSHGLSERTTHARIGARRPQGIHHPTRPMVPRLHANHERPQRAVFIAIETHRSSIGFRLSTPS